MELNDITYGNPTKNQLDFIKNKSLVDDIFDSLLNLDMPKNDSELVKKELNEIVNNLNILGQPKNEDFLKTYMAYDRNLIQSLKGIFLEEGIEIKELVTQIVLDIQSLIYKIKFYYQRPRPFQLAEYYKLKLFPYKSFTAHTPSFPSGHTIQAIVILTVIGNKYPNKFDLCMELIKDIALSRVYLGVHYPSDNDASEIIADVILKHPNFTKKYGI